MSGEPKRPHSVMSRDKAAAHATSVWEWIRYPELNPLQNGVGRVGRRRSLCHSSDNRPAD